MSYEKSDRTAQKRTRNFRLGIMIFVLVFITAIGSMHQLFPANKPVGVDALCPFGSIEAALTLLTTGALLQRIAVSSFILLAATILIALVFKRAFCGQICPLGTLQELAGMLGSTVFTKASGMPDAIDKPARYIKYLILILTIVFSVIAGNLIIRPYDPWVAYMHLSSSELFTELLIGFIILIMAFLGSTVVGRVFCRYLCPMGAFLSLLSPLGRFGIHRNAKTCINCNLCNRECPMGINIMAVEKVNSAECINCYSCVNVCPVKDTIIVANRNGKKLSSTRAVVLVLTLFISVVGATTATGQFEWKTKSLASQVTEVGNFDPQLIKGKMTLQEVVDVSGIPKEAFQDTFNIKDADFKLPIKELAITYGFETEDVREFAGDYPGTIKSDI